MMARKKLKEAFGATDSESTLSIRSNRSDEGILAVTNAVLQNIFGLSDETRSRILKLIRNQGDFQTLKQTMRQMPGVAYRRLNDVINMTRQSTSDVGAAQDAEQSGEDTDSEEFNPTPGEFDTGQERESHFNEKMTFTGYLLKELYYDEEDLRDPQKKQEIQRLMRASDQQAPQLVQRANNEEKRNARTQISQAKDPRQAQLMRKRQQLVQQIAQIDQQLRSPLNTNTNQTTPATQQPTL